VVQVRRNEHVNGAALEKEELVGRPAARKQHLPRRHLRAQPETRASISRIAYPFWRFETACACSPHAVRSIN
jgi:hypothetical protein